MILHHCPTCGCPSVKRPEECPLCPLLEARDNLVAVVDAANTVLNKNDGIYDLPPIRKVYHTASTVLADVYQQISALRDAP